MTNPLEKAQASGLRTVRKTDRLFARLGSSKHPRGLVIQSYRTHRRAMRTILRISDKLTRIMGAREVLDGLKRDVTGIVSPLFSEALESGSGAGLDQLGYYGIDLEYLLHDIDINSALNSIDGRIDRQTATILALIEMEQEELILGNERIAGTMAPAEITREGTHWLTSLTWLAFWGAVGSASSQIETAKLKFQKQALAALDLKTTDTCLRVHGQIQPRDKPFDLNSWEPRYDDEVENPPFHWYCRTGVCLYLPEYDRGSTEQMQTSANAMISP